MATEQAGAAEAACEILHAEIEYLEALALAGYARNNEEGRDDEPLMAHHNDTAAFATGGSWLTGVACFSVRPVSAEQAAGIREALKAHAPRFDRETFRAVVAEQLGLVAA